MYSIRNNAIWSPVAKYFANLPDSYDQGAAYDRYIQARHATVDLLMTIVPAVKDLLTAEQRRKLGFTASYLDTRYLASIRPGTATFTANSGFGAGGFGDVTFTAGGGQSITIVRQ